MIGFDDAPAAPIDAATLPPFANHVRCPHCQQRRPIRVHYCRCRRIAGEHFHRECECGARWAERP